MNRSREKRETLQEIKGQLDDLNPGEPCEDCCQCEGWICQGDASFIPLPLQKPSSLDAPTIINHLVS